MVAGRVRFAGYQHLRPHDQALSRSKTAILPVVCRTAEAEEGKREHPG